MTDWLRSRRAGNGDEVSALEMGFADRHHPLSSGLRKKPGQNRGGKKRQKAATNLPQYAAFCHWQLPPFTAICRPRFNAIQRHSTSAVAVENRRPHKWLSFGLVQPISGFFSHDTYPA
jgi:hypothetical protein